MHLVCFVAALLPKAVVQRYEHPFGPWRRRYMVGLVSVIAALLCADQNLLAPNVSACIGALPSFVFICLGEDSWGDDSMAGIGWQQQP
jgi:hypothetical protein